MMPPLLSITTDSQPLSFEEPRRRLAQATETLLDRRSNLDEQVASAQILHRLLGSYAGIGQGQVHPEEEQATILPDGKAISPMGAACCVLDLQRTRCFLLGVEAALKELSLRFPDERLRVLYAGCGPYATLAVPLMPRFSPERVGFTILDVHSACLEGAARVVAGLGLEAFVDEWVQGDAVTYRPSKERAPHLLIVECLQRALQSEPQIAITEALAPCLVEGGLMIPERIAVRACLVDPIHEFKPIQEEAITVPGPRQDLGALIQLTALETGAPAPQTLTLPAFDSPGVRTLALLTHIDVYGDIGLRDYESELTNLTQLDGLGEVQPNQRIELRYRRGSDPGFEARTLED